ncbi:two-component system response regulator LytT [Metabacillus crassostreae]|uniref:LytR/AlgR family response regulator transcription factor n=1 Tax=Metabacillus crassostreae TaxID=929098 RepID=UPI00195E8294|nr:LytTR family DNA-binding domain-containing protein [Metabacillus crassostreae]MBM7603517.1 two-component system response regulator LytT [Metabacillus crassostreae]
MKKHQITALIIDDERYSRDELRHLLEHDHSIDVIGEGDSGEAAIVKAIQLKPDVIFLDVEMPQMNGIDTAKAINSLKDPPLIVFATAYPDFAVDAFRYGAIDYLLKPFEEERIKETIIRLEDRLFNANHEKEATPLPKKLAIESEDGIVYIDPNEIIFAYRDDRMTKIVGKVFEYETKTPLKDFELRLKDYRFFRIHKSYLVNLKDVKKLVPWFNGAYQLELHGHKETLSVSRNYVKALRTKLEI